MLVTLTDIYVAILTIWGGVGEHFGTFISIAAFIQAPNVSAFPALMEFIS